MLQITVILLLIAAAAQADGPRRAEAERSLAELFTPEDYPLAPLRRGVEGTVGFRLEIDSRGRISRCDIIGTSGSSELDTTTCAILRERARFRPARDAEGRPVPDTTHARVRWQLEHEPYWQFAPERRVIAITWSDPDPLCFETIDGQPAGWMSAAACLEGFESAYLAVREARSRLALTMVEALHPEAGAHPPADPGADGELVWREEAHLSIAPDGRVTDCRLLSVERGGRLPFESEPTICGAYTDTEMRFVPAPEARRAHVLNAVYAETEEP